MSSVVALEASLKELGDFLKAHGFEVVNLEENRAPVDAVIYTGHNLSSVYSSNIRQTPQALQASLGHSPGVLIVNAQGKSPQEVLKILTHRSYEGFL